MSFVVDVTIQSLVVESQCLRQLKLPRDAQAYYKVFTQVDGIESLDIPLICSSTSKTNLPFNSIPYQVQIRSARDDIQLQLYCKIGDSKQSELIGQASTLASSAFGGSVNTTVQCSFTPTSKVKGKVSFQLQLGTGTAMASTKAFKRGSMRISGDTTTLLKSPFKSISRNRSGTATTNPKPKASFKFWNKPKKTKFGSRLDPNSNSIPLVITQTVECLKEQALELQGIFRESAPASEVQERIKKYDNGRDIVWREIPNKHIVAGVLMAFLLQLPEPLIPFDLYDSFMAAEDTVADRDDRARFISKLLKTLPTANSTILLYLFSFLNSLSMNAAVNKMDPHNLGIVFGPALLRKEEETVKQMIADSPSVINSIALLIEEFTFFFKDGPLLGEEHFLKEMISNDNVSCTFVSSEPLVHKKIATDEKEFHKFQDQITNHWALITRNIEQLTKDLASTEGYTVVDVQGLHSLVHSFHTIMDDPHVDSDKLQKQVISDRIASNVAGQCKTLQLALGGVMDRLYGLEANVESSAFEAHAEYVEACIVFSKVLCRLKKELDTAQSAMLSRRGSSVDVHLNTVRIVIRTISENIRVQCAGRLRQELSEANSLAQAVTIARLLGAVLAALQSESLEELDTSVMKVIAPPARSQSDRQRLHAMTEVMGYAFKELDKAIQSIQSTVDLICSVIDSRSLVQLLVGVKKYINSFIDSKAVLQEKVTVTQQAQSDDGPLTQARSHAKLNMNEFRSLLNSVLIEIDSISTFKDAHALVSLGEKCRTIAEIPEIMLERRGSNVGRIKTNRSKRQTVQGQIFVLQSMCNESFAAIRGYMFETNQEITQCADVERLKNISATLEKLNTFLRNTQ